MVLIDLQPSFLLIGLINYESPLVNNYMVFGIIMGFIVGKIIRDLLFSELIIFIDKIILQKFRISS